MVHDEANKETLDSNIMLNGEQERELVEQIKPNCINILDLII